MKKFILCFLILILFFNFSFAQRSEDYYRWLKEYNSAKSKVKTGKMLTWGGVILGTIGTTLYLTTYHYEPKSLFYQEKKRYAGYLIASTLGYITALTGIVLWSSNNRTLKALEIEGRQKKYLQISFLPSQNKLQISFILTLP
jgi:hypothetical protein